MGDKYITPKIEIFDVALSQVLCLSDKVQSGTVEGVGRMEFDW